MVAGTSSSFRAAIAAFVRAEFFSRFRRTSTDRMGTFLLSEDSLSDDEALWHALRSVPQLLPSTSIHQTGLNYDAATSWYAPDPSHRLSPCRPAPPYPDWCSYRRRSYAVSRRHPL